MNINKNNLIIILVSIVLFSFISGVTITWDKKICVYNTSEATSIQQIDTQNYIVSGYAETTGLIVSNMVVTKLNEYGDTVWFRIYPSIERGNFIRVTNDSCFIVAGYGYNYNYSSTDLKIAKLNSMGDIIWIRSYRTSDYQVANCIQQTYDGGYIVAGNIQHSSYNQDAYILKLNSNGDTLWTRIFGGNDHDLVNYIIQTVDSSYICVGYTQSFGSGMGNMWILKLNNIGDTLWTKTFGGWFYQYAMSIDETQDGGYIVGGYSASFSSSTDANVWILRLNPQGDTLWTKVYGKYGIDDACNSIKQTDDGGYIAAGFYGVTQDETNMWIIKLDSIGDTLWTQKYGHYKWNHANEIEQTSDLGYIVAGFNGGYSMWIAKLDTIGGGIVCNNEKEINQTYLGQNYPNPFSSYTCFEYSLQEKVIGKIHCTIFNSQGRIIKEIEMNNTSNENRIEFDGSSLPNGIYFLSFTINNKTYTRKVIKVG